jgi:hypothetical protein
MAVVFLLCAGLGWAVHRARVQREAVEAIRRAGGFVEYDVDWDYLYGPGGRMPRWQGWLANVVGVDYFGTVRGVVFAGNGQLGGPPVEHLGSAPRMDWPVLRIKENLMCVFGWALAALAFVLADPAAGGVIPEELVEQRFAVPRNGNMLALPVRIGGKAHPFMVDTGLNLTTFDTSLGLGPPVSLGWLRQ